MKTETKALKPEREREERGGGGRGRETLNCPSSVIGCIKGEGNYG